MKKFALVFVLILLLSPLTLAENQSEASDGRNVSGFNVKTNRSLTWCGIDFSYPSYFDVRDERSTTDWLSFYPEKKEYYASLLFQSYDFAGTQEAFDSAVPYILESTFDNDFFENAEFHQSEEISIAGLPGWHVNYTFGYTDGDGVFSHAAYSFAYNKITQQVVMLSCIYDSKDQSKYDYLGDFYNMLASAKLKVEPLDLQAINKTNTAKSYSKFVGKYFKIAGVVGEAMPPSEGMNALIILHPDIMARGMGSTLPLDINIWLTPYEFEKIGGLSSVGKQIELIEILTSISRNAVSKDTKVKGYPIQLEFGVYQ